MSMISSSIRVSLLASLIFGGALFFSGCGGMGTNTGSGYGADAGPWPSEPRRGTSTAADRPSSDEPPNAALVVTLQAKSAKDQVLQLNIARIDFKYEDRWVTVATGQTINALTSLPARIGDKGHTLLLAKTEVPRRKYSHARITMSDDKTALQQGESSLPLTIQDTVLEMNGWTLDERKINALTFQLDGAKVSLADGSATLPDKSLSIQTGIPAGGIKGKLVPSLPTAKVEVFWGDTRTSLGSAMPNAQNGEFTIDQLPSGSYRLEVRAPGHRLINPPKELITVNGKVVELPKIELAADTATR